MRITLNSFLLIELFIYNLNSLDKFIRIFALDPLFKTVEAKLLLFGGLLQPLKVVTEYLLPVLFLKHTVDEMAAEEFEFDLAS